MEKKQPKRKGQDEKEVPKTVRKLAVERLLEAVPREDWLHDGGNLLWTRRSVKRFQDHRTQVEVPSTRSRGRPFVVILEVQDEKRDIDLSKMHQQDPSEESELRRFVQVAIRTLAQKMDHLIAHGRRVLCADNQLAMDAVALKFGRELWFGYIAQVEFVNGGVSSGRLGPARPTLCLNLVASVGIPSMSVIRLIAKLGARSPEDWRGERDIERDIVWRYWEKDYSWLRAALRGEMGLRKLRVMAEYGKVKVTGKQVYGITDKPANRYMFDCDEMGGKTDVVSYFKHKHNITVQYPDLPCVQLGNVRNCVPMEFVWVMGGEHNLAVGKVRPEFQQKVTQETAMPPTRRLECIKKMMDNEDLGPKKALQDLGVDLDVQLLSLTGRQLDTPKLRDGNSGMNYPMGQSTNYSNGFAAIHPPEYEVSWGLWCFTTDRSPSQSDVDWFAVEFKKTCAEKKMRFTDARFVEWPQAFREYSNCHYWKESFSTTLADAVRANLKQLSETHPDLKLLLILLNDKNDREAITAQLYNTIKLVTETELGTFTTQFLNYSNKKGIQDARSKLNNLMLKVAPKVPHSPTGHPAFNVALFNPHRLLTKPEATMIMGADVTHKVCGISVAGVVASVNSSFATYFHEIRGQSPYTLNELKQRSRQSEERILDLSGMAQSLLQKWRKVNGKLPDKIIYYRDGVSDGQFIDVLKMELNLLVDAFQSISDTYNPQLVIIVGQKRHQTRLWLADKGKGGKGKEKGKGDKGKGKGKDPLQVPAGTVASDGIAQPSHLNFFLVSQEGIQGTSVPCHYHILHMDERLVKKGYKVDDFETITFQLCHLYSRADKSVGYATPAYMADHACERGKCYLEAQFGVGDIDSRSTLGSSSTEDKQEDKLREEIEERKSWLNMKVAASSARDRLNGLQFYC
ncbi:AGO2 [Symbiodinium natans]|uniref:AGO2 protein n=1 Tax=Symbiodinium natans TaxID=878477 RepID=A0A812RY33_9DINO|nr:AGO2 [Symbiodinium natans]